MRAVNVVIFFLLGICVFVGYFPYKKENICWTKGREWIRHNSYVVLIICVANIVSISMTFVPAKTEIYVEKGVYGEEEKQIPFVLQKGEESKEVLLTVRARQLTKEELKEKVEKAFLYFEKNLKGENSSLTEIYTNLDYSLDREEYPFDVEFVSADYALVDREGNVKNSREELKLLGYTEKEIEKGITTDIEVTLWYGEESFERVFSVTIFEKEKTVLEEQFQKVTDTLLTMEQEASYEKGFAIPTNIDEIKINQMGEKVLTPGHVLLAGIILAILLVLREQENKRKQLEDRKTNLIRSYPWFVNEMVLLLGAGMQVRNIFRTIIQECENQMSEKDYRKPLIDELKVTIHAMELGISEEQAYYRLGRRLGIPCYIKIMTLLEQNVKRGGKGLMDMFEQEETVALEERKNLAKRYGEEAGTKLLGPMILLLLVVMLMIMVPALWSFA